MGRLVVVYHDLASLDGGANFALSECVLVRIPGRIQVEGHVENDATAVGTGLPPTLHGTSPLHKERRSSSHLQQTDRRCQSISSSTPNFVILSPHA